MKPHPASFRDPSGFVFEKEGVIYRTVHPSYQKHFDYFISSGLYQALMDRNWIVPFEVIEEEMTEGVYKMLKPDRVERISYPSEWCFDMWKDAALLTLQINQLAIEKGMILKDASAFNIQWHGGRLQLIDSLSFEIYDESLPWIAYRQFCSFFLAPLALMHFRKQPLQPLLLAYPEGIPIELAAALLPSSSKWHLFTYLHLHLHGRQSKKLKGANGRSGQPGFSKTKMLNLLKSLESAVRHYRWNAKTAWSGYYTEAALRADYLESKKEIFREWITSLPKGQALDAGSNEGSFSLLLYETGFKVTSLDFDHDPVNQLYLKCRDEKKDILPLIADLANPTPSFGLNSIERAGLLSRMKADLVIALALIHHLAIGRNIPFEAIAALFKSLGKTLIIEFVPKNDVKVQEMLAVKKDIYTDYTSAHFLSVFSRHYRIVRQQTIGSSERTLYLMEPHEAFKA